MSFVETKNECVHLLLGVVGGIDIESREKTTNDVVATLDYDALSIGFDEVRVHQQKPYRMDDGSAAKPEDFFCGWFTVCFFVPLLKCVR